MEAFGIFEGGGAKGIAHLGALKAAEDCDVRFLGVAGTSAGAIIAALIAAGYTADELYDPEKTNSVFNRDLTSFFNTRSWADLKNFTSEFSNSTDKKSGTIALAWRVGLAFLLAFGVGLLALFIPTFDSLRYIFASFLLVIFFLLLVLVYFPPKGPAWTFVRLFYQRQSILWKVLKNRGLLTTDSFEEWLNDLLLAKMQALDPCFSPSGTDKKVTFQDLKLPLKVIASDVTDQKLKVFSSPQDNTQVVAEAVSASISIPFVFVPRTISGINYVDGGIVSNFPAWVFDRERENAPLLTPTLGFRIVNSPDSTSGQTSVEDFLSYSINVLKTAAFGDNSLETRDVATLHEIPLPVSIDTLDFELSEKSKANVFREAQVEVLEYFRTGRIWRQQEERVQKCLRAVDHYLKGLLKHQGHLRLNVMQPVGDTLQIIYTYNMDNDDDCDDKLQFRRGSGACGTCWDTAGFVVCDLLDAVESHKIKWKMDKYQQRLVRKSLKSLLSIPLYNQKRLTGPGGDSVDDRHLLIGVLNIDSDDETLISAFSNLVREKAYDLKNIGALMADSIV